VAKGAPVRSRRLGRRYNNSHERPLSGPPCPIFVHSMSYRQTVCNPALNLTLDRGDTLVHGEIDKGAFR
jgi:hypothetical protein